jgi:hypothetical protein
METAREDRGTADDGVPPDRDGVVADDGGHSADEEELMGEDEHQDEHDEESTFIPEVFNVFSIFFMLLPFAPTTPSNSQLFFSLPSYNSLLFLFQDEVGETPGAMPRGDRAFDEAMEDAELDNTEGATGGDAVLTGPCGTGNPFVDSMVVPGRLGWVPNPLQAEYMEAKDDAGRPLGSDGQGTGIGEWPDRDEDNGLGILHLCQALLSVDNAELRVECAPPGVTEEHRQELQRRGKGISRNMVDAFMAMVRATGSLCWSADLLSPERMDQFLKGLYSIVARQGTVYLEQQQLPLLDLLIDCPAPNWQKTRFSSKHAPETEQGRRLYRSQHVSPLMVNLGIVTHFYSLECIAAKVAELVRRCQEARTRRDRFHATYVFLHSMRKQIGPEGACHYFIGMLLAAEFEWEALSPLVKDAAGLTGPELAEIEYCHRDLRRWQKLFLAEGHSSRRAVQLATIQATYQYPETVAFMLTPDVPTGLVPHEILVRRYRFRVKLCVTVPEDTRSTQEIIKNVDPPALKINFAGIPRVPACLFYPASPPVDNAQPLSGAAIVPTINRKTQFELSRPFGPLSVPLSTQMRPIVFRDHLAYRYITALRSQGRLCDAYQYQAKELDKLEEIADRAGCHDTVGRYKHLRPNPLVVPPAASLPVREVQDRACGQEDDSNNVKHPRKWYDIPTLADEFVTGSRVVTGIAERFEPAKKEAYPPHPTTKKRVWDLTGCASSGVVTPHTADIPRSTEQQLIASSLWPHVRPYYDLYNEKLLATVKPVGREMQEEIQFTLWAQAWLVENEFKVTAQTQFEFTSVLYYKGWMGNTLYKMISNDVGPGPLAPPPAAAPSLHEDDVVQFDEAPETGMDTPGRKRSHTSSPDQSPPAVKRVDSKKTPPARERDPSPMAGSSGGTAFRFGSTAARRDPFQFRPRPSASGGSSSVVQEEVDDDIDDQPAKKKSSRSGKKRSRQELATTLMPALPDIYQDLPDCNLEGTDARCLPAPVQRALYDSVCARPNPWLKEECDAFQAQLKGRDPVIEDTRRVPTDRIVRPKFLSKEGVVVMMDDVKLQRQSDEDCDWVRCNYVATCLGSIDYLDSYCMPASWLLQRRAPDAFDLNDRARAAHPWLQTAVNAVKWTQGDDLYAGRCRQFYFLLRVEDVHINLGLTALHTPGSLSLMSLSGSRQVWDEEGKAHLAQTFFNARDYAVCPIPGCKSPGSTSSDWVAPHLRDHYGIALVCSMCEFATHSSKNWRKHCGSAKHQRHLVEYDIPPPVKVGAITQIRSGYVSKVRKALLAVDDDDTESVNLAVD